MRVDSSFSLMQLCRQLHAFPQLRGQRSDTRRLRPTPCLRSVVFRKRIQDPPDPHQCLLTEFATTVRVRWHYQAEASCHRRSETDTGKSQTAANLLDPREAPDQSPDL